MPTYITGRVEKVKPSRFSLRLDKDIHMITEQGARLELSVRGENVTLPREGEMVRTIRFVGQDILIQRQKPEGKWVVVQDNRGDFAFWLRFEGKMVWRGPWQHLRDLFIPPDDQRFTFEIVQARYDYLLVPCENPISQFIIN